MSAAEQVVRFTKVGERMVAWASAGSGPPVVFGGWWCSHLELDWQNTLFRRFSDMFTDRFTMIRYDRPGTGLSDRVGMPMISLDDEVALLSAVVDEAGERVSLFGGSSGSCVAAAYAASHPDRVERLVLYGSYARGTEIAGPEARESVLSVVARHWGVGSRLLADLFVPTGTTAERDEFVRFQRASATPDSAVASLRAVYAFDVRDRLDSITVPTLVVHRRDDRAIPFALGQDVAARVPGASFVALDGVDHLPWRGDAEAIADTVVRFLGPDRPLAPAAGMTAGMTADVTAQVTAAELADLSGREVEVLRLIALGLSDQEIAGRLVLSVHTVHRHVANIRRKLGLPSRAAAAAHAARAGLI
jgi:pimeloyl-ACP methyl ester carboxylesterase/DNA-binding CsgD family transcriptional regulator